MGTKSREQGTGNGEQLERRVGVGGKGTGKCAWCGEEFEAHRRYQRFCSLRCHKAYWNNDPETRARNVRSPEAKAKQSARYYQRKELARRRTERANRIEGAMIAVQAMIADLYENAAMSAAARSGLCDCIKTIANARFPKAKTA